jgi:hypothetical protein
MSSMLPGSVFGEGGRRGEMGKMTPSGWHDDAHTRDAGHDDMQMAVWLELKRQIENEDMPGLEVIPEFPIIRRRAGIVAFADIALLWFNRNKQINQAVLYELKPKIGTVFGILRQAICLEKAFASVYPTARCLVEAVVPHGDPKLPDLSRLIGCITWNGNDLTHFRPAPAAQLVFNLAAVQAG